MASRLALWLTPQLEGFFTQVMLVRAKRTAPTRYASAVTDTGAGYLSKIGLWFELHKNSVRIEDKGTLCKLTGSKPAI